MKAVLEIYDKLKTKRSTARSGQLEIRSPENMVIKREVAYGIVRGMAEFWKCEELQDFTVMVGTVPFGCHRFLLAACSGFFRGLFRSGMKETGRSNATLKEIHSQTFELILKTMYTGRGVLTNDNVIEIWRAAHQLQIHFLMSECEDFVIKTLSLDNYVDYYHASKTLSSAAVLGIVWAFILNNCNSFFQTSYFLELPLADVLSLVKSQDLETKTEDDVIRGIMKWAEFIPYTEPQNENSSPDVTLDLDKCNQGHESFEAGCGNPSNSGEDFSKTNEKKTDSETGKDLQRAKISSGKIPKADDRRKSITILLSQARICLVSPNCLETLLRHPWIRDNREIRETTTEALLYQLQKDKRNGQWPFGATYRNNNELENVALAAMKEGDGTNIKVYSFSREAWFQLPKLCIKKTVCFAFIGSSLYAIGINLSNEIQTQVPVTQRHCFDSQSNTQFRFSAQTFTPEIVFGQTTYQSVSGPTMGESEITLSLFLLSDGRWSEIKSQMILPTQNFLVAVVETFIYIFSSNGQKVLKLDVATRSCFTLQDALPDEQICHAMSYDQWILVFYASAVEGVDETVIYCYDTSLDTWTELNRLEGPADGMTSFRDDHFTYILQSNGDMWKVVEPQSNIIDFEFVVKLWSCDWSLHGAVIFLDELHIFGVGSNDIQNDSHVRKCLPGVFGNISYKQITPVENSNIMPAVLNKKYFV